MPLDAWIVLAMLMAMFALLIVTKIPAWVIFLGTLAAAMTLGLAPESALLKGFSNGGVLTVAVLFMVAAGMYRTGAITIVADRLIGRPSGVGQALRRILPPVAAASAFLNNTPLVAMMIPVVRDLARSNDRVAGSQVYMPLSLSSILGGATTLIGTSSNLIIAGLVATQLASGGAEGLTAIGIFTPTVVALPAALIGIVFVLVTARRLLPERGPQAEQRDPSKRYLAVFVVDPSGPLVGRGLAQSGLSSFAGAELVAHQSADECAWLGEAPGAGQAALGEEGGEARQGAGRFVPLEADVVVRRAFRKVATVAGDALKPPLSVLRPRLADGDITLEGGDVLTYSGSLEAVMGLWTTIGLRAAMAPVKMEHGLHTHRLVEVVMTETSEAVGHHVVHLPLEYKHLFHAKVVAVALRDGLPREGIEHLRVEPGDTLLLEVSPSFLYDSRNEADFALVRHLHGYKIQRTSRAPVAGVIVLVMVLLAAFNVTTMLNAALLATFALFISGSLSFRTALASIEWDTVIVLGAAVGLEAAVTQSGLSQTIADLLTRIGGGSPYIALVVVFLGAVIMTNVITNAAAAAFIFPVALAMAAEMGVSAMPLVMALMLGVSYAFVNPVGYQTNLMVQKPGGYTFGDFAKVGLPLTVLVGIVVCVLIPIFFPFALP